MNPLTTSITKFALLAGILVGALTTNYLFAAWSAPGSSPTGGNVAAPVNVGGTAQTKSGDFTTSGELTAGGNLHINGRTLRFGASQSLLGDDQSALYWTNNHDTVTQLIMRDKQNTVYGRLYGNGNGTNFGLLDGDGSWSYLAAKDNYTQFRINNDPKMTINSSGQVGIGDTSPDGGMKLDVEGKVGATEYCDQNGGNCVAISSLSSATGGIGFGSGDVVAVDVGDRNGVSWFLTGTKPAAVKTRSTSNYAYCALGDIRMHSREDTGTDTWNKSCRLSRSGGDWVFEARVTDFNRESVYCKYYCISK